MCPPQKCDKLIDVNYQNRAYFNLRRKKSCHRNLRGIASHHNQWTHSTTHQTPFFLIMGYEPAAIPTINPETEAPAATKRLKELSQVRQEALAAHELARQQMAERITRHFVPFKKEEKVWLEARNLNLGIPYRKLKPKREGPFEITKVLSP